MFDHDSNSDYLSPLMDVVIGRLLALHNISLTKSIDCDSTNTMAGLGKVREPYRFQKFLFY